MSREEHVLRHHHRQLRITHQSPANPCVGKPCQLGKREDHHVVARRDHGRRRRRRRRRRVRRVNETGPMVHAIVDREVRAVQGRFGVVVRVVRRNHHLDNVRRVSFGVVIGREVSALKEAI